MPSVNDIEEGIFYENKGEFMQEDAVQKKRSLLILDRESQELTRISKLFQRVGYQTFTTLMGREACKTVKKITPSLILTAMDLEDMSGIAFISQLRQNRKTEHIPVVVLQGSQDTAKEQDYLDVGAAVCLCKSASIETMYQTVQALQEKELRKKIRIQTHHPVKIETAPFCDHYGMHTLTLSERGMFLSSRVHATVNTRLALRINLKGLIIAAETRVLYNGQSRRNFHRESGLGLEFITIEPQDREFIRAFINNEIMKDVQPEIGSQLSAC